jgi:hypothetical protein
VTSFPLSDAWWASGINFLLAWEDCTDEWLGVSLAIGFKGVGAGKVKFFQQGCWQTVR